MKFFLQFGYGMMKLCNEFLENWGETTVILSPRDLEPNTLLKFSKKLNKQGGKVILDPQFYLPRADHKRLISHAYWPPEYETQGFNEHGYHEMIANLAEYNHQFGSTEFIIPGERADTVDDLWLDSQEKLFQEVRNSTDLPVLMTICLSAEAMRSSEQISSVMSLAERLRPDGYYLVFEHPANQYLVSDPIWLTNSLDLVSGLALLGGKVIVGYCNQQQLMLACAGASAIATGTWKNVRSFPLEKFKESDEDDDVQRTVWYYCPEAFSEYTLNLMELAIFRSGLDPNLLTSGLSTPYTNSLFSAPRPTLSEWKDGLSFRHYLTAMLFQCQDLSCATYDETLSRYRSALDVAKNLLEHFHSLKLKGGDRDFQKVIEATEAALDFSDSTYGARLRRQWDNLL